MEIDTTTDINAYTQKDSVPQPTETSVERYYEFTGTPDLAKFNDEVVKITAEAKEAGITPVNQILLNIQINALYGHTIENSSTLRGVFSSIVGAISLVPIKLENNKKLVWGNITDRGTPLDIPQYRMPRIL